MVLIVSVSEEPSIQAVRDWLEYYGKGSCIVQYSDFEEVADGVIISGEKTEFSIKINGSNISIDDVSSLWFRKSNSSKKDTYNVKVDLQKTVKDYLNAERINLKKGLFFLVNNKFQLGNPFVNDINKIFALQKALENGLRIPDTYIVSSREYLVKILNKDRKLVTKNIHSSFRYIEGNNIFLMYTSEAYIDAEEIEEVFFPTLFQEMIDKDVEIRTFVIEDKIFSMAIFSQLDKQTQVDFRRYNHTKMNRMVPFKLPESIEVKIINFMKSINLNTGSIDLIKDKYGNYYFLEINPTGQYGFLSAMCNYNLDEVIASQLISSKKTFTNGQETIS